MKLILTDYVGSLKEDKELENLLQDLLRDYNFEIIYGPHKGQRQYGVDIYAIGEDPEDNQRKVFLLTIKQGNLDRKNWQGTTQSLDASLREIVTVFIRNNLAPEHRSLPTKVIVCHNGINDPAIQQNWTAFTEEYPGIQFAIWQLETIVNRVHERMASEQILTDETRLLLRKIVVYLINPDYDFTDYKSFLDKVIGQLHESVTEKKKNIKSLKKLRMILAIIISYCQRENDSRLALKATEITLLRLWQFISMHESQLDEDYIKEFIEILIARRKVTHQYLDRLLPVFEIKDGLSRECGDPITYNMIAYEHLGFVALAGLEFLQMSEFYLNKNDELVSQLQNEAGHCAVGVINIFNNNRVIYNPRADNQIIEINLAFLLFFKLGMTKEIRTLLMEFNNQLAHGKLLLNIEPLYSNSIDKIIDLDVNYDARKAYEYKSSCLLTTLVEWIVILNDKPVYDAYLTLKSKVFSHIELTLWFPDKKTEEKFYIGNALPSTGYCLSNILLTEDFEEFKVTTLRDHLFNCEEQEYLFIRQGLWTLGLMASRHYRTYVFPYYWRKLINNVCAFSVK